MSAERKVVKEREVKARPAIKIAGDENWPIDQGSAQLLERGWALKTKIEALQIELDAVNAALLEAHGTGCALVIAGACRASLSERRLPRIVEQDKLRALLGGRFDDLVREEVSYKAERRLLDMAADGDEPLAPALRECISYAVSQTVTWRAEK